MRLSRLAIVTAAALGGLILALPAAAQFRNNDAAIRYRQSVMSLQGFHFGRIAAMTGDRVAYDAKVVADDTQVLETIASLPYIAFGEGTDKGNTARTRARPEIWTERGKFDAAATRLKDDVAKLSAAVKSGNQDQVKAAAGAVGKSCDNCHDSFQAKL